MKPAKVFVNKVDLHLLQYAMMFLDIWFSKKHFGHVIQALGMSGFIYLEGNAFLFTKFYPF